MNKGSLIQSQQAPKQGTLVILLLLGVLIVWPALSRTTLADQTKQDQSLDRGVTVTTFVYQGQLIESGVPTTGVYDFRFTLYAAQTGGDALGAFPQESTILTNGLFKVSLDFGRTVANSQETWLEIAVRPSGSGASYTVLSPRQRLTPTPYAILAQREEWSLIGVPVGFAGAGAQDTVLTGEQAALGTTMNYIPKFTGNAFVPLTESVMYETGNNIGVGTTTPTQKLDVMGTVKATAFQGDGSALSGLVKKAGDTMTGTLNLPTNGLVAGTSQLVLTGSNVGVGTSTPEAKLDVRHSATASPPPSFAIRRTFLSVPPNPPTLVTDLIVQSGNVGIGTTSPKAKLDVTGGAVVTVEGAGIGALLVPIAIRGLATSGIGVYGQGSSNGTGLWGDSNRGTGVVASSASGDIIRGNGGGTLRFRVDNDGDVFAKSYMNISDARLKTHVQPLTGVLEKVQQLRGVSYERINANRSSNGSTARREVGVIAQEVEAVFPELVSKWGDQGYKAVDYTKLAAVLIEAVKELKSDNEALRAKLRSLMQVIEQLKEAVGK